MFGRKWDIKKLELSYHCILGKQYRVEFESDMHSRSLKYVHFDLWGPTMVEINGIYLYFLTMIDDFSIRVWIHVLKHKSEIF